MSNKYNITIKDFVDVQKNNSFFDLNDLVHICRRKNNNKREYLFVNKYQGKHIPESPYKILSLFNNFCAEVKNHLNPSEKIVVVGFAETATAIAEYLTYYLTLDAEFKDTVVYHLQTSREEYTDCKKLFSFDEEHSHAVNQFLYCNSKLPTYDRILFVEDEITTGHTILNFISKFREINPNSKYTVSSILNWQNKENTNIFKENGIDVICLVKGELKDERPSLKSYEDNEIIDYFSEDYKNNNEIYKAKSINLPNSREGVSPNSFKENCDLFVDNIIMDLCQFVDNYDRVMVIGTEEFMLYPLMVARDIEVSLGSDVFYRATTRSPICAINQEDYIIKDGITLPSAYSKDRQTYLYNMNSDYNKIVVITDGKNEQFYQALNEFANRNKKKIYFYSV